jgi:6-pyruvoyltetrahydropterin/6-carboxytetrahydropterin synthase
MIRLTRRYRFAALHRLQVPHLSEEENRTLYGKCANPHGHGHDYVLDISVRGPVDRVSGRVVDPHTLDGLVARLVLGPLAHQDLNAALGAVPTTENLAREIFERLRRGWQRVFPSEWPRLERVRLAETPRNLIEIVETL